MTMTMTMTMTMAMTIKNCFADDYVYLYVYVFISYVKKGDGPYNFYNYIHSIVLFFIYSDLPSKYTKLEESFERFMNKSHHCIQLFMVPVTRVRLILLDNSEYFT